MGLFDGYFDPDQFGNGGGLLGRLLALQQQQGPYQPGADLDQAPAAPQTSAPALVRWPNLSTNGQSPSVTQSPTPHLHSQYQALRPVLGDRNAMLAAVSPDVGQTLVAQALANQQPDNAADVVQAGYRLGGIPFPPMAPGPPPPMPMPPIPEWWKAAGVLLQLYPEILKGTFGDAAPGAAGPVILKAVRPPAGSRPISETNWSGDHDEIKGAINAGATDDVRISPAGEVWARNPDGSWTNHGPADSFTGSGKPSGRRGKDRDQWR